MVATRYAGASSGTLDVANTALVHNCFIKCTRHVEDNETWIDECMLKGLHANGGFMRLDNCDLELPPGFDLQDPDTVVTEMLADNGGLFAFTYTQNSGSTVETAPIKLNNAAVRREKQTNQAINSPVALYLYQSFGTTGARIEASLNNTWRFDRFDDPGDVELAFGLTTIVNGGTLASINGSYTPAGGRETTDVVSFNFISAGGGAALQPVSTPLEEAIVGDNCVVKLTGTWDSTNNLPEMVGATKGNLPFNENTTTNLTATASGYSAALDFERDELSKSTVGMPRGSSVVSVGIDTGAPTNNVHALYFDGVDYQCDGTDDRTQIQSAIDAVAEFGGVVQLGPGVLNVDNGSDPILEIPANVTLRGMGAGVTTIVLQGTNGVGVELTGNRATLDALTVQTNFDSEIAVAVLMSGSLTLMRECEVDATASAYSGVAVAMKITGSDNRALDSTMRGRVDDVSLEFSGEGAYNLVSGCRRLNGDVQIESDDNRLLGCEIRVGNLAINGDRNDVSECTLGNGNMDVDGDANRVCNNRLLSGGVNVQVGANDANITHNTTTAALSDSGTLSFFGDQTSDSNQVT